MAASQEGFGLVGAVVEPDGGHLLERMRGRRARLYRVTAGGPTRVYEGPGWIQALDCQGAVCVAIGASLKPSGSGSDYHLLVSTDGGREWQHRGPVDAPSVSQVQAVSEREVWLLGASCLGRTVDGGATWSAVALSGERDPLSERLRHTARGVAVLGRGLALTADGGATWTHLAVSGARILDVSEAFVAASVEGEARVGELQGPEVRWLPPLPPGREPVRLAAAEGALRVLSRSASPGQSAERVLHVSEEGGQSWSHHPLELGPQVDIAGRQYGLGVDPRGHLHGRLA